MFSLIASNLTVRIVLSMMTALCLVLILSPVLIRLLRNLQMNQSIRDDGPSSHLVKKGTPTMGGGIMLLAITFSVICWGHWKNIALHQVMFLMLGYGWIGWIDDYRKVVLKNSKGLSARKKFFMQSLFASISIVWINYTQTMPEQTQLYLPLMQPIVLNPWGFFSILSYCVIVGSSNAVNLTDGLDGLAIMSIVMVMAALGVIARIEGTIHCVHGVMIPYLPNVAELAIFSAAVVGAGLGFLWFNSYPAEIFMGDVGSLALGGGLGLMAVLIRQECLLFLMGGLFVIETCSVILQVLSYKIRGKRIFRMAPIHHYFELKGWPESKIIIRFWIMTVVFVFTGLALVCLG